MYPADLWSDFNNFMALHIEFTALKLNSNVFDSCQNWNKNLPRRNVVYTFT